MGGCLSLAADGSRRADLDCKISERFLPSTTELITSLSKGLLWPRVMVSLKGRLFRLVSVKLSCLNRRLGISGLRSDLRS